VTGSPNGPRRFCSCVCRDSRSTASVKAATLRPGHSTGPPHDEQAPLETCPREAAPRKTRRVEGKPQTEPEQQATSICRRFQGNLAPDAFLRTGRMAGSMGAVFRRHVLVCGLVRRHLNCLKARSGRPAPCQARRPRFPNVRSEARTPLTRPHGSCHATTLQLTFGCSAYWKLLVRPGLRVHEPSTAQGRIRPTRRISVSSSNR
jgi:hypothetical protein